MCGNCNTPLVGSTLNRRYRYYRCRGTFPTATAPRYYFAGYIRSDKLEEAVWGTVRDVLEDPTVALVEMRWLRQGEGNPLDEEIARLQKEIRRCHDQELRLVKLSQFGEVDDEWIKTQSGPVKARREDSEAELQRLIEQKARAQELERSEDQLREFCERVRRNLKTFDLAGCGRKVRRSAAVYGASTVSAAFGMW